MTPNALRSRLAFVAKQYPKVLNETAYVVAHTVGVDRDAVTSATERGEDVLPLFGNDRHPAEVLIPWVAKELHNLRKAIDKDETSLFDFDAVVDTLESKLPAIATWVEQARPDLTQLTMTEALQAVATFEPENTAPVPQGKVIYRFADGWSVQELLTAEQVYPEGIAVQNCLREDRSGPRYCNRINAGEIRIFSLRTLRGEPRVSMMLEIDEDSKHGGRFEEIFAKQNTSLNATLEDTGDEALWAGIQKYKPRVQEFIRESFSSEPVGLLLAGASLRGFDLRGVDLDLVRLPGADLRGADLSSATLVDANLKGANLTGANLTSANLTGAHLSYANLTGANLFSANMRDAWVFNVDLTGANLGDANLSGAELVRTNMNRANLSRAKLSRANLIGADLSGADLSGALLLGADLSEANLTSANLTGTILLSANLTDANLTGTKHDKSTVWPQGFSVDSVQPNRRASRRASKRTSKRTSKRISRISKRRTSRGSR